MIDREGIQGRAEDLALDLSHLAESLLIASHRLRDHSIQAHGEAVAITSRAAKRLPELETAIRENGLRWTPKKDGAL